MVEAGLLMPPFLAKVDSRLVRSELQKLLTSDKYKGIYI